MVNGERIRVFDDARLYDGAAAAAAALTNRDAVIEGFAAMHYPAVVAICGLHVHLATPWRICADRRGTRQRRPSDRSWFKLGEAWHEPIQALQRSIPGTLLLEDESIDRQLDRVVSRLEELELRAAG